MIFKLHFKESTGRHRNYFISIRAQIFPLLPLIIHIDTVNINCERPHWQNKISAKYFVNSMHR